MTVTQRAVSKAVRSQVPTLAVALLLVIAYVAGTMNCRGASDYRTAVETRGP